MPANIDIFINGKDQTGAAISSAKSGLAGLGASAESTSSKFGLMTVAVGTAIGTMAANAITKMGEMAASVVTTGFEFNNMKQQAEIAFTTMLGSGTLAKSFLDELQAFAAKTPFEFADLTRAAQRMLAMGFESKQVLPTLTAIGDAVAGLGGSSAMVDRVTTALGQMQAKGKATGEEMMQLTEAGIPAWEFLANKIGVSIPEAMKMVTNGAVSADVAIGALVDGMNTKFGGLMEAQSKTFGGLLSTIKDTFAQISGKITQPVFDVISKGLAMIVEWTSSPSFTAGVDSFAGKMQALGGIFERVLFWMGEGLTLSGALKVALGEVLPDSLYARFEKFIGIASGAWRVLKNLFVDMRAFEDDAPMVRYLLDLGDTARETFQSMWTQAGKVVARLWDWVERVMPPLVEHLAKFFEWMGKAIDIAKIVLKPLADAIAKFVKLDDVMAALGILMAGPLWTAMSGIVAALGTFLGPIAAVVAAVAALRWAWQNDFGGIRTFTLATLDKITDWFYKESGLWKGSWEDTVAALIQAVRDLPLRVMNKFYELRSKLTTWTIYTRERFAEWKQKVYDTFAGWANDVERIFTIWKDRAIGEFNKFFNPIKKDLTDWIAITKSDIDQWVIYWTNKATEWKDNIIEKFELVFDWWDEHIQPWIDSGIAIMQGLWDGMKEKWNDLSDWFTGVWGTLTTNFKKFFGIASPSTLFFGYGRNIMDGLNTGIAGGVAWVQKTLEDGSKVMENVIDKQWRPVVQSAGHRIMEDLAASMALSKWRVTAEVESITNSLTSQMARLQGAIVQNVFDINNAAAQLKINPAFLPESMGGTGKVVGLGPNGELILEGINNLPHHTPLAGPAAPIIPTTTIGSAVGGNLTAGATSQGLLGGITLATPDITSAQDSAKAAAEKVQAFISGLSDFLGGTVAISTVDKVYRSLDSNLSGFVELRAAGDKIRQSMADVLGISSLYGDLSENVALVMDKIGAGTDLNQVANLLQSAVDFRTLANHYGTADFAEVLPTDTRLTGGALTNNYNITLQGSNNANADVLGLVELLGSLQGAAVR